MWVVQSSFGPGRTALSAAGRGAATSWNGGSGHCVESYPSFNTHEGVESVQELSSSSFSSSYIFPLSSSQTRGQTERINPNSPVLIPEEWGYGPREDHHHPPDPHNNMERKDFSPDLDTDEQSPAEARKSVFFLCDDRDNVVSSPYALGWFYGHQCRVSSSCPSCLLPTLLKGFISGDSQTFKKSVLHCHPCCWMFVVSLTLEWVPLSGKTDHTVKSWMNVIDCCSMIKTGQVCSDLYISWWRDFLSGFINRTHGFWGSM